MSALKCLPRSSERTPLSGCVIQRQKIRNFCTKYSQSGCEVNFDVAECMWWDFARGKILVFPCSVLWEHLRPPLQQSHPEAYLCGWCQTSALGLTSRWRWMDSGCSVGSPIAQQFNRRLFQQGETRQQQGGWIEGLDEGGESGLMRGVWWLMGRHH